MGKGTGEKEVEDMLLQMGEQHNGRINYLSFVKFWRQFVLQMSISPKQQLQKAVKKTVTMLRAARSLSSDHHHDHHHNQPPDKDSLSLSLSLSSSRMASIGTDDTENNETWRTVEDVIDCKDNERGPYTSVNVVHEKQVMKSGTDADTQPIKRRRISTMSVDGT